MSTDIFHYNFYMEYLSIIFVKKLYNTWNSSISKIKKYTNTHNTHLMDILIIYLNVSGSDILIVPLIFTIIYLKEKMNKVNY